jgi:hypothetical protein
MVSLPPGFDEFVKTENNHREHKAHRDNLLKIKIFSL